MEPTKPTCMPAQLGHQYSGTTQQFASIHWHHANVDNSNVFLIQHACRFIRRQLARLPPRTGI